MLVDIDLVLAKIQVYIAAAWVEYGKAVKLNLPKVVQFYVDYITEYEQKERVLQDAKKIFANGGLKTDDTQTDANTVRLIQSVYRLQYTTPVFFLNNYNVVSSNCMLTILKQYALSYDTPNRESLDCQSFTADELRTALLTSSNSITSGDITQIKNLPIRFWAVVTGELNDSRRSSSSESYLIRCIETVSSSCSVDFFKEMDEILKSPPKYMLKVLEGFLYRGIIEFYTTLEPTAPIQQPPKKKFKVEIKNEQDYGISPDGEDVL